MYYKEYNGWANYPTWRVNLEILGDIQWVEEEIEILKEIAEIKRKDNPVWGV